LFEPANILIIQTAFIGDAILATALLEDVHRHFPKAKISMLVREGNEIFFEDHPFVSAVYAWRKKESKYKHLWLLTRQVRAARFDLVINLHRFAASGWITALSGASTKVGFDKNPLSFFYTHRVKHSLDQGQHEVERNAALLRAVSPAPCINKPRLYPSQKQQEKIKSFLGKPFLTISPNSVWFTKTAPATFWKDLIEAHQDWVIYVLGAPSDRKHGDALIAMTKHQRITNLCGQLSLMESAALMQFASMNFTNDSAPMHLCSAMNAPVTAVYCSTVPAFGFGPLSERSVILETKANLDCRPCGLHGHKACPKGHFKCGDLNTDAVRIALSK
jgi:ADP-heptose:LPS heptosyltransferase